MTLRAGEPGTPPDAAFVVLAPFALGAGLMGSLAFPLTGWWPLLFGAVLVLALVIEHAGSLRRALLLGWAFGLTFNLATLSWQANVLVASYLGLAAVQSLYFAALGGLLQAVRRLRWAPVAAASCWVLMEFVQSRFPFGGFSWTRLGYAMVDTPLAGLYPVAGVWLASFAVALAAHSAAWAVTHRTPRRLVIAAGALAGPVAAGLLGSLLVVSPAGASTINVGWVQGGASGEGFYGLGEPGQTGLNHAAETRRLMAKVASGTLPEPEFIVWPENGTDYDPFLDGTTNKLLSDAVSQAGVPILVAVPTSGPKAGQRQTTDLWWTATGATARYDKRNLVPFGEWIPFRELLLPAIPMLEVIGDQAVPGDTPGALSVTDGQGRPLTVGVAICYEVAFDSTLFDSVRAGSEVMIVGSNNAMFQGTSQIEQQFAITRVRAAEMGRQVLVVTTSGISGLIDEHGRVVFRGAEHDADSGVVSLTRTTAQTPAVQVGWLGEDLVALIGALGVVWGLVGRRRAPEWTGTRPDQDKDPIDD